MYVPHHFAETDQDSIRAFIRSHGFGTLVSWDGVRPVATQLLLKPFVRFGFRNGANRTHGEG